MKIFSYITGTLKAITGTLASMVYREIYSRVSQYALARFILQLGKSYNNFKKTIMKMENLEYVKNTLKLRGLENKDLFEKVDKYIGNGIEEFSLPVKMAYGKDEVEFQVHIRKGKDENYRLSKFEASMKDEQGNERKQTFYHSRNMSTTGKEAYNLLSGRAVHKKMVSKDGNEYQAWVQLKLSETDKNGNHPMDRYNENWGFKLQEALKELPIQGLRNEEDFNKVMDSLKKGNAHMVYIENDGNKQQVYLQANPSKRTVDMYDKEMQPVQVVSQKEKYTAAKADEVKEEQTTDKSKTKTAKQEPGEQTDKQKTRRKGMTA